LIAVSNAVVYQPALPRTDARWTLGPLSERAQSIARLTTWLTRVALPLMLIAGGAATHAVASAPASEPALRIAFADARTDAIAAPPSAQPRVFGQLSGVPQAAGAQITVLQQSPSGGTEVVQIATAGGQGKFSVLLPPGGTRSIVAVYGQLTSNALTEREAVWVQLRVAARQVRSGGSVGFRGSLPNAQGVRLLVALEVKRSRGYEPFDVLRSDTGGEFGGRFPLTIRGAHYDFRAYVPPQVGLSLEPGTSGVVDVTVT
jgi:hypothetical protein